MADVFALKENADTLFEGLGKTDGPLRIKDTAHARGHRHVVFDRVMVPQVGTMGGQVVLLSYLQGWTAMNARFHATLIAAADNKVLANAIREIGQMPLVGAQALSLHGIAPQREYAFIQRAQLDHEDVLSAILAGESARAEALMREHARRSRDNKSILLAAALKLS